MDTLKMSLSVADVAADFAPNNQNNNNNNGNFGVELMKALSQTQNKKQQQPSSLIQAKQSNPRSKLQPTNQATNQPTSQPATKAADLCGFFLLL